MFNRKIELKIATPGMILPLSKYNLVILRAKGSLSSEQYKRLKSQIDEVKKLSEDVIFKVILIEDGVAVDTIISSNEPIWKNE